MRQTNTKSSGWCAKRRRHCSGITGNWGKERLKICVFRRFLKTVGDGADVTLGGRVFHSREEATGKARSPTVDCWLFWKLCYRSSDGCHACLRESRCRGVPEKQNTIKLKKKHNQE